MSTITISNEEYMDTGWPAFMLRQTGEFPNCLDNRSPGKHYVNLSLAYAIPGGFEISSFASVTTVAASGALATSVTVLHEVNSAYGVLQLVTPVAISVFQQDGNWFAQNTELSILSIGRSMREALQSFQDDFAILWDEIAQTPDDDLTTGATTVKRLLRSMVQTLTYR